MSTEKRMRIERRRVLCVCVEVTRQAMVEDKYMRVRDERCTGGRNPVEGLPLTCRDLVGRRRFAARHRPDYLLRSKGASVAGLRSAN